MGRLVLHWVCVLALVALPVGGCSDETTAAGGTGGDGGTGGSHVEVTVERILVAPEDTDPAIDDPIGGDHVVYVPSVSMRPELFVHFVGGSAVPEDTVGLSQEWLAPFIAQHMKVIVPQYVNAQALGDFCFPDPDPDCFENVILERIYGTDESPHENVSEPNGIVHRLVKLLEWLDVEQPAVGWSDYLDAGKPRWDRITLSGHSNGTSMAALIARDHDVGRVLMFDGPSDKAMGETADWLTDPKVTPIDRYFGFIHVDQPTFFVPSNWENMGLPGPPVVVDDSAPPYSGSHFLQTNADVPPTCGLPVSCTHASVIGIVSPFTFEETWLHMCCSELP